MGARKQSSARIVTDNFRDLKKIIKRKRAKTAANPVTVKKKEKLSDEAFFFASMREVQEIEEFRMIPLYQKKTAREGKGGSSDREALNVLEAIVEGKYPLHLPDTEEYNEWIHPDYREDIVHKLHEGRYSVQDTLDIHGCFLDEAEAEVGQFIKGSLMKGYHCIKIIHGRGLRSPKGPVLKNAVVAWLSKRFRKYIIAFVTARQCDGGLGALYILLK